MTCHHCKEHMMVVAHDRAGRPISWWCWRDKLRMASERVKTQIVYVRADAQSTTQANLRS